MKRSVLPLLVCPTAGCGGPLALDPGAALRPLGPEAPGAPADELLEGILRCGGCRTEYPVLSGVAILAPRPQEYLRRHHPSLLRDLERYGRLSPEGRRWLSRFAWSAETAEYGADFRFSQQFEDPWELARWMTGEPEALYGAFAEWLRRLSGNGPYDLLARWARERAVARHFALDAGCGGGGLLARLAPHFDLAFGLDLSFLAVLLARRAVLHRPEAERFYRFSPRRGEERERPLPLRPAENAEFLVADCTAPPFPPGLFDAVCSSNVIDIAGMEGPLEAAARALRPGGLLLLSDPFFFRDGEAPPGDPRAALHALLERLRLRVEVAQDGVPWAWATYDRHWRIYFNYCLAARREE